MRRLTALVILVLASQVATAQLLTESFTDTVFPPPGWVVYNADGGPNQMERKTTHYNTAPACAYCLDETDRQASDWICTPPLHPQGADTIFRWQYRGLSIGHRESISVWLSTTDQQYTSFTNFVKGFGINSNTYLPESVSLGAFVGQRVYVGIEYCSGPSELNIYVDDVSGPPLHYRDVGVTAIAVPPDFGTAGQSYYSSVSVYNYADTTQTGFPVFVVIRDSATNAVVFTDSTAAGAVAPGQTITVNFPTAWVAATGVFLVESYTALSDDLHPANDTFTKYTRIALAPPTVTVVVPNGGELWQVGSSQTISWSHGGGAADGDSVWYRTSDADPWQFITAVGAGVTSYLWSPVPNTPSESCMVRVKVWNTAGDDEDESDAHFTIAYQDVGATNILAPLGTYDSGTVVTPQAQVYNYGSRTETFPVTLRIGSGYDETVTGVTVAPGQWQTVNFPNWVAEPLGRHLVYSFTDLAGDQNRYNDTVWGEDSITVILPPRHDVATLEILAPIGTMDSGTVVTPTAVIHNYGTRTENFSVTFNVAGYSEMVPATLAMGQTDTVSFPDWVAEPIGSHIEYCFTALDGDTFPWNDTSYAKIYVDYPERHDVGATAILAPTGSIDSGTVVTPQAVVYNYGTRTETFPVTFTVAGYSQTVNATLAMGETDTVSFPTWVAEPIGDHGTTAFTGLATDANRWNDTVTGSIYVDYPERHDVGATAILAPVGTIDSGTVVTPRALVYNFGTRTETFPVTFTVAGYNQTVNATLAMGETDTLSFPNWTAQPIGVHDEYCFTSLPGDENRSNDTALAEVTVFYPPRHDVGATAILAPVGTIDSGTVVTPRAVVYNFGTRTETFPVTFTVAGYSQTVNATLTMGETDTLSFTNWTAQPIGAHTARCFTNLTGDENRGNDTAVANVTVNYPPRHDVGARSILAPVGTLDSGTVVTPRAVVYNFGTRTETFPVTFTVAGYSQTVNATLTMGETDTLSFPNWTAQPVGVHNAVAFTNLTSDQNRSNDTARTTVTILYPERHDVGATAILAPIGVIDSGTVVTPQAVVYNFGTRTETFPVTFAVGAYSQTQNATLAMGETDTLTFPDWTAEPLGQLAVTAFTALANDRDRSNDTVRSTVTVDYPPRHDVGATAILSPQGAFDSGAVVTPQVVVHNFGTRTETFPATFRVGGYNQTVNATLAMGETDTLSFPDWVAEPIGSLTTVAYTSLMADERPANDTVTGTVDVGYPERHDVGATAILAPAGSIDSGTVVTPQAVVYNFGTRTETFPVTFTVAGYSETVQATLAMGETDTLSFPDWVAEPIGWHLPTAWTELGADRDRSNDTAVSADSIFVNYPERHDVGAVAIIAPLGSLDSGTVVAPQAMVYNFGTRAEFFPVTFEIGTGYSQTVTGVALDPGQSTTVTFPQWVAQPVGDHAIRSFTDLAADENRANDSVFGADTLAGSGDTIHVTYPERHDIAALVILDPLGTIDEGTMVRPRAVVHNYGTRTDNFPVTFAIGSYSQTVQATLAMGETDTLTFPDWAAGPVGSLSAACHADLELDQNRANDTARTAVQVIYVTDIGVAAVLAPLGAIELAECYLIAEPVAPRCRVTNYGQQAESGFNVLLRIDSVDTRGDTTVVGTAWEQTIDVSAMLDPGESAEVEFDAVELGIADYVVRCSTILASDHQTANDAAEVPYRVAAYTSSPGEGDFTVVIYTRAGERVRRVTNHIYAGDPLIVEWDSRNDRGNQAAPGVYLCHARFEPVGGTAEEQVTKILVTDKTTKHVLHWRKP
jgi:hypothetical protein